MESLKDVHQSVCNTLHEWNYEQTDIVHIVDLVHALYSSLGASSVLRYHVVCMCLSGKIVDYGDGLYGINEEYTS